MWTQTDLRPSRLSAYQPPVPGRIVGDVSLRARATPYLLLGVLTLGTGLGIGLGLSEAPTTRSMNVAAQETTLLPPGFQYYGETLSLPEGSTSPTDITRVTVYSLLYPVGYQALGSALPAEVGREFAVAFAGECAGPTGIQNGLDPLDFDLVFPKGTSGQLFPRGTGSQPVLIGLPNRPSLAAIGTLSPGQCAVGAVTFEIPVGSSPKIVSYHLLFPNRTYYWTPLPKTPPGNP